MTFEEMFAPLNRGVNSLLRGQYRTVNLIVLFGLQCPLLAALCLMTIV